MIAPLIWLAALTVACSYALVGVRFGRANLPRIYQSVADEQRRRYPALYPSVESVFSDSFSKSNEMTAHGLYVASIFFWPVFAWRWSTSRKPSAFQRANPGRQAILERRVRELERELGIKP